MVAKAEQVDEVELIDLSGRDVHVCLIPDIDGFKHLDVFRRTRRATRSSRPRKVYSIGSIKSPCIQLWCKSHAPVAGVWLA